VTTLAEYRWIAEPAKKVLNFGIKSEENIPEDIEEECVKRLEEMIKKDPSLADKEIMAVKMDPQTKRPITRRVRLGDLPKLPRGHPDRKFWVYSLL
jgi:hypothetical protein